MKDHRQGSSGASAGDFLGQATGVGLDLQHEWRHRADKHGLGRTDLAVPGQVSDDFAPPVEWPTLTASSRSRFSVTAARSSA
jgi:hypothetical protein